MKNNSRSPFKGTTRLFGIIFLTIVTIMCMVISNTTNAEVEEQEQVQEEIVIQPEQIEQKPEEPTYRYKITLEEKDMLVRLVFLEANTESLECQKAVISVVINRWKSGYWGDTLHDVVYAKGQFSTAKNIPIAIPTANNYEAVDDVLRNGCTLPEYVLYFRADYHFNWKGYVPYKAIDHTYFGYIEKDKTIK